jgi:uncharacterized protein (DUF1800 family)
MMSHSPRRILILAVLLVLCAGSALYAKKKSAPTAADEPKRALHALNRLTFGPRPGDVDRVVAFGLDQWIEQQLHPEKIDDAAVDARLAPLRTLRMDTRELAENFPNQQVIKAVVEGKASMPRDPEKRAIYEAQLERYDEKREKKQQAAENPPASNDNAMKKGKDTDDEQARRREARMYADLKSQDLLDLPPDQRVEQILKMQPDEQRAIVEQKDESREQLMEGMSPKQKETLMALNAPQRVVLSELMQAKLLRAIYSERQLDEVMADFWFNHFNIFINKGADRYLVTSYERDVIRPHALGKFEDLLVATAKSPAMLFYLDNWLSVGPDSDSARGVVRRNINRRPYGGWRRFPPPPPRPLRPQANKSKRSGLNENYARELMELHTLGVNGGYTQRDVTEVARVFTGWTIKQPRFGAEFSFEEKLHEPGTKTVLGHKIKDHGEKEGRDVLHLLAHHPSTARFICTKLATRFVSDTPPPALVDRMAQIFLKKDGDIREVLRAMFQSPEFWAPEAYRAKVKTPLEFVASAVRATGADVTDATPLIRTLQTLGMPLYGMQPPTGYSMKAETWVNSSALLSRMNFALALGNGKLHGVQVDLQHFAGDSTAPADGPQVLATIEKAFLAGDISVQTHDTIIKQLEDPQVSGRKLDDTKRPPNVGAIAGLILGSPEFQRR